MSHALSELLRARAATNHLTVEEAVQAQGTARAHFGLKKYGVTLDRQDLSQMEVLQHAKEEAMDLVRYIEVQQRLLECSPPSNSPNVP